jgi:hypothetical protein
MLDPIIATQSPNAYALHQLSWLYLGVAGHAPARKAQIEQVEGTRHAAEGA